MKTSAASKNELIKKILQSLFVLIWIAGLSWSVVHLHGISIRQKENYKTAFRKTIFERVLPAFDNEPWKETLKNGDHLFFVAKNQSAPTQEYQTTPPVISLPVLEVLPKKQRHVSGFAFVMKENPAAKIFYLVGVDLNGEVRGIQALDFEGLTRTELPKEIFEKAALQSKEFFLAHRDLLMFQLEPPPEPIAAELIESEPKPEAANAGI